MRLGITYRVSVVVVVAVLLLGGSLAAFFVTEQERTLRRERDRRVEQLGRHLVANLLGAGLEEESADLDAVLVATISDPEIAFVLVKNPAGDIRTGRWMTASTPPVAEYAFPLAAPTASASGSSGGTVVIGVDLSAVSAARRRLLARTAVAVVTAALVAALFGLGFVRLLLRRSLSPLLAGIRGFGAGELGTRIPPSVRRDELDEIGGAFNDMADRLAQRAAELTEALAARQRVQERLAERQQRIRLLLDSTAEAIVGLDPDGAVTFCNPACVRALGFASADDLIGRNLHAAAHHMTREGAPFPETACRVYQTLRDRHSYHSDEEYLWRKDGSWFPAELWSHPMLRDGVFEGAVVTFLDLTERKRLEGEVLKMRKLESLGVLAGGIAHDFNNLLMGILGNLTLAREEIADPAEATSLLREAEEATLRARKLTQQLLTFSKGGLPVKKVVSVRPIVEESSRFALSGSAVGLAQTFAPELWPVEADAGQLGQVVHNLALNAAQAMPAGGAIEIACANVRLAEGEVVTLPAGSYVRISVRDHGGGIPPEHLSRIFDPYFTTKAGGHGLGLASVFSIVKKHGGHVTVASTLGAGTRFEVYLPAAPGAAPEGAAVPARAAVAGRRSRVLVMDDEASIRKVAAGMLARLGQDVETAADGAAAIEQVRAAKAAGLPFDLLILDLTVPGGMGGVETLEKVRAGDPAVVAIAASGYSNDPVIARFRDYGFSAALSKPYTQDDLAKALSAALAAARG